MIEQHTHYSRRAVLAALAALGSAGAGLPAILRTGAALAETVPDAGSGDAATVGRLVAATRLFGFRLFGKLVMSQPEQNVFISPSSVAIALAMTYNGAAGATRQAMAATLGLQGMSLPEVDRASAALATKLRALDPHVELTVANSLWARLGIPFTPAFLRTTARFFDARTTSLDFNKPQAAAIINAWVSRETRGKITRIVADRIDPATILFLINAIYFKGRWSAPFDKGRTQPRPFTVPGGAHKIVPMMARQGHYPYYRGHTFQAISLPYGTGSWSMDVFLPDQGTSLVELQQGLVAGAWETWLRGFSPAFGAIALPRFTVGYGADLSNTLAGLGMSVAFDRTRADFSAMVQDRGTYISMVNHKAVIAVDEEGTTAAAATGVGVSTSAVEAAQFQMVVDRPFLCAIRDSVTGTVLFLGAIVDPAAAPGS